MKVYDKIKSRRSHELVCKARQQSLEVTTPANTNNVSTTNNNHTTITNNNNSNNTVINIVQNNHNTIVPNPFGQEEWDGLFYLEGTQGEKEFKNLQTQLVTQGMDGISKLIEHHYFNKDYPKNHTIRKPVKNNDFVEVHVGNNEWEHKTMATAMEEIKKSTTMYLHPMIDDVLNESYEQDDRMQKYVNRLFTNVLVPMNYVFCEQYKDRLRDIEPVETHVSEQHGQIVMRNMKTVLYQLSLKLKTLSDTIDGSSPMDLIA